MTRDTRGGGLKQKWTGVYQISTPKEEVRGKGYSTLTPLNGPFVEFYDPFNL